MAQQAAFRDAMRTAVGGPGMLDTLIEVTYGPDPSLTSDSLCIQRRRWVRLSRHSEITRSTNSERFCCEHFAG